MIDYKKTSKMLRTKSIRNDKRSYNKIKSIINDNKIQIRCPFKTNGCYCTHIANSIRINSKKKAHCIYLMGTCPFLNAIKEEDNVIPKKK